jgi:C-terminal processing protease CtpA/Prc
MLAQRRDRTLVVREAPSGLAAAGAGLRPGDQILLIDGRDVRPMNPRELHAALSGEVGDPVKLTVVRSEQILRVTLRRTPARPNAPAPAGVTTRAN